MTQSLIKTIQAEYLAARYAKDTLKANLLSTLLGEAQTIGKDAGNRDASDDETITIIKKFIKNANEVAEVTRNNHQGMINAYKEIEILETYLPKQMSGLEIKTNIESYLAAHPSANMGEIMKYFKTNFNNLYDGRTVSTIIKEYI